MKRSSKKKVSPIKKLKSSRDPISFIYKAVVRAVNKFSKEEAVSEQMFPLNRVLAPFGFKKKRTDGLSGYIFVNKDVGIVVKRPYLCSRNEHIVPARGIPTKIIEVSDTTDDYDDQGSYIFIQPLADVSRRARTKASRILNRWFENSQEGSTDMHEGNVAMWNGKAVRIDW